MPTTSNFGWNTPADTDLVKDGATAIRTLGNNIDASLVDLKGGTTNQVLAKNSNTDLDYKWVTSETGIPASLIDAKGDLIAGSAADTAARLPVGTNGQYLSADSSTSTGLKWVGAPSPSSNWTLISSGAITTGTTATFAVSGYDRYIVHFNIYIEGSPTVKFRLNNLSATNYRYGAFTPGAVSTSTDVDGISFDNFSVWAGQPSGFFYVNNANTGTKPQFFGDWTKPNTSAKYTVSGLYNANITVSEINVVSTLTFGELSYRVWGL